MAVKTSPDSKKAFNSLMLPGAVIALIAVAAIALHMTKSPASSPEDVPAAVSTQNQESRSLGGEYQDGEYVAQGSYTTPGGEKTVTITLALEDGVVSAAEFEGHASDPASKRFQAEFAENYTPKVVGKNVDDIELDKVSGSSLTPKGFMDALQSIKVQAQS